MTLISRLETTIGIYLVSIYTTLINHPRTTPSVILEGQDLWPSKIVTQCYHSFISFDKFKVGHERRRSPHLQIQRITIFHRQRSPESWKLLPDVNAAIERSFSYENLVPANKIIELCRTQARWGGCDLKFRHLKTVRKAPKMESLLCVLIYVQSSSKTGIKL